MTRPYRMAVVNSHPIQYFAPLYAFLNREPGLAVTALYCSDSSLRGAMDPGFGKKVVWDVDLLAGYPSVFLGHAARSRTPDGFWSLVCPAVWTEVSSGRYDAVLLHGYTYAANLLAFLAAKTHGVAVLLRSETHRRLRRGSWRGRLRDAVLSLAYRFVDGFLAIGSANREYYVGLGVPERKIFDVPYAVDNSRFTVAAALARDHGDEIRKQYGLPPTGPIVLYVSKLMRRKHPDVVIRAFARLQSEGSNAVLFMVGTGEMESELKALTDSLNLKDIVFGGFINQSELPRVFAACDVFVLPAENEPWGLVVNEVMCAGKPVIVSSEVGCVPDLVKDGVNGYLIKPRDVDSLVIALRQVLCDESLRRRMGDASLSIINHWGYEECRRGIQTALHQSVRRSKCVATI